MACDPKSCEHLAAAYEAASVDRARLSAEREKLLGLLARWLAFSSDVVAGDAAGHDWLESLKRETSEAFPSTTPKERI